MTGSTVPVVAVLRTMWRTDRRALVTLALVVAVLVAGLVGVQRALADAQAQSVREVVEEAASNGELLRIGLADGFRPAPPQSPLATVEEALSDFVDRLDFEVLALFAEPTLVVDTPAFGVVTVGDAEPATPTSVVLRVHDDLVDHSEVVEGRAPRPADEQLGDLAVVEIAVTPESAAEAGWRVGTELLVDVDFDDPLYRAYGDEAAPAWLRVVGLIELDDPQDPYFAGDERLHRPIVNDTPAGAERRVYAALTPEQLPSATAAFAPSLGLRVEQRRQLDPSTISLDTIDDVRAGIRTLEASAGGAGSSGAPAVTVALGTTLDSEADRRSTALDAVTIASVGVVAVAVAALLALQRVAATRRRATLLQLRARGATASTLLTASSVASTSMIVGGAIVGTIGGVAVTLGAEGRSVSEAAVLVGLVVVATSAAMMIDQFLETREVAGRGPIGSRWRVATRVLVGALAIGSVVLLRREGVGVGEALDPGAVAATVLVPTAIGLLALVLVGLVAGRRLGSLRLGVGRLVGLRRLAAPRVGSSLILVALAVSVSVVSVHLRTQIDSTIDEWSWREAGGPASIDVRRTGDVNGLDDQTLAPSDVASARVGSQRTTVERVDGTTAAISVTALDVVEFDRLTAGTPAGFDALSANAIALTDATAEGAIPVLASRRLDGVAVRAGDQLSGQGRFAGATFVVVATDDGPFVERGAGLLADRRVAEELTGLEVPIDTIVVDADDGRQLAEVGVEVTFRQELADARHDDRLVKIASVGFVAAAIAVLLLACGGVVAAIVVSARRRRRQLGVLLALGSPHRELGRSTRAELLPWTILGIAVGAVAGGLMVRLLDGRFDLADLTVGGGQSRVLRIEPLVVAAVVAVFLVAVVAAVLVSTALSVSSRRQLDHVRAGLSIEGGRR